METRLSRLAWGWCALSLSLTKTALSKRSYPKWNRIPTLLRFWFICRKRSAADHEVRIIVIGQPVTTTWSRGTKTSLGTPAICGSDRSLSAIAGRDQRDPATVAGISFLPFSTFVTTLVRGGENLYDGWMKDRKFAMISYNDGYWPISFLLETLDKETEESRVIYWCSRGSYFRIYSITAFGYVLLFSALCQRSFYRWLAHVRSQPGT